MPRFARAVELSPTHADALYHLAVQRDLAGDTQGALDAARRVVALRGTYEDRYLHAYVLLKRGRVPEAVAMFSALLRERPDDPRAKHNLEVARTAR